jgi:hypothetical protein
VYCEPEWCNQRRSVGLVFKSNGQTYERSASGFLINNEKMDSRPYFLTANHIFDLNNDGLISQSELNLITSVKIVFNYQHTNCNTGAIIEPQLNNYVIGASLVAQVDVSSGSLGDWILLELSDRVPSDFAVYFSGYYISDTRSESITMIHHPKGDIKKIASYNKKPQRKIYTWNITKWSNGGVEGGSSGAPWFNENKQVVGIQSSSNTSNVCTNKKQNSSAGRIDIAYNANNTASRQLMRWLSPNSTNSFYISGISGWDPCRASYFFENANDLHTSDNVNGLPILQPPFFIPVFSEPSPGTRSYDGIYTSSGQISTGLNVLIQPNTKVEFHGQSIVLNPGFIAENGSIFIANPQPCLGGCNNGKSLEEDFEVLVDYNYKKKSLKELDFDDDFDDILEEIALLNIFPNPAQSSFTLTYQEENIQHIKIKIVDMRGSCVYEHNISNIAGSLTQQIDVAHLSSGIYFVLVENEYNEIKRARLVVQ